MHRMQKRQNCKKSKGLKGFIDCNKSIECEDCHDCKNARK